MYLLGAVWSLFRVVYFLVAPFVGGWWIYVIVYAFPTNIQVALFTLLLLYCAQRVHYDHWYRIKRVLFVSYGVVNGALLVLFAVYATVSLLFSQEKQRWIVLMMSAVFVVCFALLVVGYVAYTVLLARQKHRHALFKHESRATLLALMVTITLCLTIRCVWDIINLAEAQAVHIFSDNLREQLMVVVLFLTWEIIPLLSVIVFFGKIPHAVAAVVIPATDASSSDAAAAAVATAVATAAAAPDGTTHTGSSGTTVTPFSGRAGTMTSPSPSGSQVYDETLPLLLSDSKPPGALAPDAASVNTDAADLLLPTAPAAGGTIGSVVSGAGAGTAGGAGTGSTHHAHAAAPSFVMRGTCPLVQSDGSTPNYCFVTQQLAGLRTDGHSLFTSATSDGPATTSFVQY